MEKSRKQYEEQTNDTIDQPTQASTMDPHFNSAIQTLIIDYTVL